MEHHDEHRPPARAGRAGTRTAARSTLLDVVQLLTGIWLLVSPAVFPGPSELATATDVLVGLLLLGLCAGARLRAPVRAAQGPLLLLLGAVLIAAVVALELGAGPSATARQWNEVVVEVLLVCLAAARAR